MASSSSSSSSSSSLQAKAGFNILEFSCVFMALLLFAVSNCFIGADGYSIPCTYDTVTFNRSSFPAGFVFGTATSAYQVEGAANVDGRGPSIWDTFTHRYPDKIADRSNGDVAVDSYHMYKEDVKLMKEMGLDAHRLSISWSRVLPTGKLSGGINKKGVEYYNNLINELLANGIQPYVTLFHWDLPQSLEDEYGGFLSHKVVDDFRDYTDLCFKEFGDRVKHWITLNEPWTYSFGYAIGVVAPGRCSDWQKMNCTGGDAATEPYLTTHNQILSHAAAVQLYKHKYQEYQKGIIGVTLNSHWFIPYNSSAEDDVNAVERSLDFMLGWFLDPIMNGDYPHIMRSFVGSRLPNFTEEQSKLVKGSFDFIGMNYYTTFYARYSPKSSNVNLSYKTDSLAEPHTERDGIPIGPRTSLNWCSIYPDGIRELLLYVKKKYGNPLIYITENGVTEFNNDTTLPLEQQLADPIRIQYYHGHLSYLNQAIKEGVNVKGYFAWSLLDNFEWSHGYTVRYGINYVDYKNGLKRYPKHSFFWFRDFLKKN